MSLQKTGSKVIWKGERDS
uniref:Uncharacterized protein n=1 Tax=Rhizophora mucronata TaxID=61149 RepID=A0A2P2PCE2_RHIMU